VTDTAVDVLDVIVIEVSPPIGETVVLDPIGLPGTPGENGFAGWTPVLAIVNDGARRVERLVDFIGGEGDKPDSEIGKYVGVTGFVTDITLAVDVRGAQGATGPQGAQGDAGAVVIGEGTDILTGHGAPTDDMGIDNELYIDVDTGNLYKKLSGHWVLQASLKGPKGDKGDKGDQGDAGPQGAAGSAGATGATGAAGAKGDKGDTGDAGSAGASGLSLHVGTGAPGSGLGVVGDSYIDGASFNFYSKTGVSSWTLIGNIKGTAGAAGAAGVDGATIHTGSGAPSSGLGANGDQYIDTTAFNLYGKSGGSWTLEGSLHGPAGADGATGATGAKGDKGDKGDTGAQLLVGSGAPSSGLGNNGDQYVDNVSHHLYSKSAGAWTDQGVLAGDKGDKGDTGDTGADGADGAPGATGATGAAGADGDDFLSGAGVPSGALGKNGDTYLNVSNGDLYGPKSAGAWGSVVGNLKGATGATGSAGADGARGSVWSTGSGAPTTGSPAGVLNGDFYLRSSNGEVYKYVSGAWADQGFSIVGPAGSAGSAGSAGARGSLWYTGSAAPTTGNPAGVANGDNYLRSSNGEVYTYTAGAWVDQSFSLQGPQGATGATGASGASGSSGIVSQWAFDTTTTNSDPGAGKFRASSGSPVDAFNIYLSKTNSGSTDLTTQIDALIAGTQDGTYDLVLRMFPGTPGTGANTGTWTARVTSITKNTNYYTLACVSLNNGGPFANTTASTLQFVQSQITTARKAPPILSGASNKTGFPSFTTTSASVLAMNFSTMYLMPFWCEYAIRITKLGCVVSVPKATDGRLFIFRLVRNQVNSAAGGGVTLYDSGLQASFFNAGSQIPATSPNLNVEPGYYCAGLAVGSGTSTKVSANAFAGFHNERPDLSVQSGGVIQTIGTMTVAVDETNTALSTMPTPTYTAGTITLGFVCPMWMQYFELD
jgi:hypothetical protein